ncbi:glycosyltransferase [Gottfriedia acidiceleris]|uniref:glycosyltransferase n=1 Tax=Gottfriedia acidiceleris TaxID=371036 RepID=UPI002FFE5F40
MNIMHVGEYVSGGVATYLRTVILYQEECEKVEKISLLMSDKNSEDISQHLKNTDIIRYPYERKIFSMLRQIFSFRKILKKDKPDVIHIHSSFAGVMMRLAIMTIPKFNGVVVYCAHGWSFLIPDISNLKKQLYLIIEKILSSVTSKIVNISQYEHINSINLGIPSNKSQVINSGILDQVKRDREVENKDIFNSPESIKLGFIGRFDRAKGLDLLLSVINKININIELLIIGDSILGDGGDIDKYKCNPNIHFIGWVDSKSIDSYIQKVDAIVIPSRWEGFGLVALEAMKNHKAVISSKSGALPEIVKHNENGFLFDIENEESLILLLNNIDKMSLKRMGLNGYRLFKKNFTENGMNRQLIQLYSDELAKK